MTPHARRVPPRARHFIRLVSALALIALIASCDLLTTLGLESDDPGTASLIGDLELNTIAGNTDYVSLDDDFYEFRIPSSGNETIVYDSIPQGTSYDIEFRWEQP